MPARSKATVVTTLAGFVNVAVPGPFTIDQAVVNVPPAGKPSSFAVPANVANAGSVIVCGDPALTAGGTFVGTGALTENSEPVDACWTPVFTVTV